MNWGFFAFKFWSVWGLFWYAVGKMMHFQEVPPWDAPLITMLNPHGILNFQMF